MSGLETTLGGAKEQFPETVWSSAVAEADPAALDRFFSEYWRPVYKFIRTAGKAPIEDAKDLTQEFFRYLIEGGLLARYRREKGRFRSFLKGVLRNFLSQARRDAHAQKRGGGQAVVSLDVEGLETERFLADRDRLSAEEIFDRQWAADVLSQSLAELRRLLAAEGRAECLRVYEAYELASQAPTYGDVARTFGLTEHQVKSHLDAARARLEEIVRGRLARGVSSPGELADEMNELFSG
jgi:RNA polymerase sigma factor (sigma-70 family)